MTRLKIRTHPDGGKTVHGDEVPSGTTELVIGGSDEYPEGQR